MNAYEAAFAQLVKESGVTVRRYRTTNSGVAYTESEDWGVEVPPPTTPLRFGIAAHEIGHQLLHRHTSAPRWREEWEAWDFALAQFERFELPGVEIAVKRASQSLRRAAVKALRSSRGNRRSLLDRIEAVYPAWVTTGSEW